MLSTTKTRPRGWRGRGEGEGQGGAAGCLVGQGEGQAAAPARSPWCRPPPPPVFPRPTAPTRTPRPVAAPGVTGCPCPGDLRRRHSATRRAAQQGHPPAPAPPPAGAWLWRGLVHAHSPMVMTGGARATARRLPRAGRRLTTDMFGSSPSPHGRSQHRDDTQGCLLCRRLYSLIHENDFYS